MCCALHAALLASPTQLAAQWQSNTGPNGAALGAIVGGDVERYVRALALAGLIDPVPWSARPFSSRDLHALLADTTATAHPWQSAMKTALSHTATLAGMGFASVNSGFPWGANDGPMWQGRGATLAIGAAASARLGPFILVAAPVAFSAQNASFPLQTPIVAGVSPFADPLFPTAVDLPQRMGASSYTRASLGESSVRLQSAGLEVGLASTSLGWGTGEAFPAILGSNAGGFPHAFAGTSARGRRVPLLGRLVARYVFGTLGQTPWSRVSGSRSFVDVSEPGTQRLATGLTASIMPAIAPGLEIGATRFYHSPYRRGARRWSAWSKPFEGIFKAGFTERFADDGDPGGDTDNQLAAFFARWVLPKRGVEATFELFREDHSWDARDQAMEPENNSAVLASIRAVTRKRPSELALLTFEYFDGDVRTIAQQRAQNFLYAHAPLRQGHTQRGQLLGTPIGVGGIAGARVAWERFTPSGSLRANVQRWRSRAQPSTDPEGLFRAPASAISNSHDWIIDASLSSTRYRDRRSLTIEGGMAWAGRWQLDAQRTNLYSRLSWGMF